MRITGSRPSYLRPTSEGGQWARWVESVTYWVGSGRVRKVDLWTTLPNMAPDFGPRRMDVQDLDGIVRLCQQIDARKTVDGAGVTPDVTLVVDCRVSDDMWKPKVNWHM